MDGKQTSAPPGISQLKFSRNVQAVTYQILDLPPSCIEFVPRDKAPQELGVSNDYFVIGTYNLEKNSQDSASIAPNSNDGGVTNDPPNPQERNGTLSLFNIRGDKSLILVERILYPSAILDLHFLPGEPIFAVASSTGAVSIYTLSLIRHNIGVDSKKNTENKTSEWGFRHIMTHQVFPADILVLSFIWIPDSGTDNTPYLMAATSSAGEVYIISFSNWDFTTFKILNDDLPINIHDAEAWCCVSCPSTNWLYSGGDDSQLRVVNLNLAALQDPENTNDLIGGADTMRGHDAGVTAILPLPYRRNRLFLTGSYDDHIRLYTWQNAAGHPLPKPREIARLNLGGGVWKLKFMEEHPVAGGPGRQVKYRVLASCMYIGAKIVEVSLEESEGWKINIVAEVKVHESMCYGCDIVPLRNSIIQVDEAVNPEQSRAKGINANEIDVDEKRLVVSTSFYDKLLFVWVFDPTT